jgi:hypothetical protein
MFHQALESIAVAVWPVIEEGGRGRTLHTRRAAGLDLATVGLARGSVLAVSGVRGVATTHIRAVEAIPQTPLGKPAIVRPERPLSQLGGLR